VALAIFANLPASEQIIIEDLARSQASPAGTRPGPLAATLFEMAKVRITAERYVDQIPNSESWRSTTAERAQ
jgi:hypothetical protein